MTWSKITAGITAIGLAFAIISVGVLGGCDLPPEPPKTAEGALAKNISVDPADAEEAAAVSEFQAAAGQYEQALKVLLAYYVRVGAYNKQMWARKEMKNLAGARTFRFEGLAQPAPPPGQSFATITEPAAVEEVLSARRKWLDRLDGLITLYSRGGRDFKLSLVKNVRRRFDPVRTYAYFLSAEIPPASLRPTDVDAAADRLFAEALQLHKAGKPLPGITDYDKQRKALLKFLRLVREYPSSRQIARSAYYIADIYKEYFNENLRAVAWYERARQWDPHISLPAWSQAAFVYDLRLGRRGKALSLYRDAIENEQFDWTRVRYARQRIKELTR